MKGLISCVTSTGTDPVEGERWVVDHDYLDAWTRGTLVDPSQGGVSGDLNYFLQTQDQGILVSAHPTYENSATSDKINWLPPFEFTVFTQDVSTKSEGIDLTWGDYVE